MAARKVNGLLAVAATIVVISPQLTTALVKLAETDVIQWIQAPYQSGMLTAYAPHIVFAATDDSAVNAQITQEAQEQHLLVNSVDDPTISDFSNMAAIRRQPILIGLHTGSTSPALARHLKQRIAAVIGPEYETLAAWLGELRPLVRRQIPTQGQRQAFYQTILDSEVLPTLRQGRVDDARNLFDALIQQWS